MWLCVDDRPSRKTKTSVLWDTPAMCRHKLCDTEHYPTQKVNCKWPAFVFHFFRQRTTKSFTIHFSHSRMDSKSVLGRKRWLLRHQHISLLGPSSSTAPHAPANNYNTTMETIYRVSLDIHMYLTVELLFVITTN